MQGSWKKKLRDRFKWLRRKPVPSGDNSTSRDCDPPPPKKKKGSKRLDQSAEDPILEDDVESYDEKVIQMQKGCTKSKKDHDNIQLSTLMKETFKQRRHWIRKQPPVSEILDTQTGMSV